MSASERTESLPLRTRLFYGLGEIGEGVKTSALETFLFFFYVQVVGLPGSYVGMALLAALVVDAITDPIIGTWSDRLRSRLGRRHPFLYAAPVPLAIALCLLFSPPQASPLFLAVWLGVFATLARFAMTLYFVPHMALGADLSEDFNERIALGGYRTVFGFAGRMIPVFIGFSLFFANRPGYPNGQLDASAYPGFALTIGVVAVVAVLVSAAGTQTQALARQKVRRKGTATANPFRLLVNALRSRSLRALFLSLLIMYLYNGVQSALNLHMNTYFWQLKPQSIQFVLYASMAGMIFGVPFGRPVAAALDKKRALILGVSASVLLGSGPALLRLAGLMPPNGSEALLPVLVAAGFLSGFTGALAAVLPPAMLADLSDEHDHREGLRAEGLLFGLNAFCRQVSLGLGGAAAGFMIDAIHFPKKAAPGSIGDDTLTQLGILYAPVMLVVLFIGLGFFLTYDLSRERHASILTELRERDGA